MCSFHVYRATTSVRAANYTAENVENMVAVYSAASSDSSRKEAVFSLATSLGKSTKSIIAKLSREGAYIKAAKATKSGKVIVKKEAIVSNIAKSLSLDFDDIKSLGKATKADLENLMLALS